MCSSDLVAMGGGTYYITMPEVVNVELVGKLKPFVSAKDIILEVLRELSVKGGVGRVIEYTGEGIKNLTVPERATITNMGAELGATTSIFPSDEVTKSFLKAQGREEVWQALAPDADAVYDKKLVICLDDLEPLVAAPHSPDNVQSVKEVAGTKVNQVAIGSCTNGSYLDLMRVAKIVKGKQVNINVVEVANPDLDAALVARKIAEQLENRQSFRTTQKKAIQQTMRSGAKGIKTIVSGRLGGADIARGEGYSEGVVPLHTLRSDIDYAHYEANTTYGKLGVKVWICRGEVLPGQMVKEPEAPKFPERRDNRRRRDNNRRPNNNRNAAPKTQAAPVVQEGGN